ncbi:hypothetical protein [Crossiella cryophila]|uniref:Lipoprotein n=1 Tax=Crossiella cryophila TaxID=43355 RepID=A0A7W7CEK6_9PSEU|nr:hypothetical protein [Crossiella cryophila]MBB4679738.1 hypothetical protein [Crossiella cryophila]
MRRTVIAGLAIALVALLSGCDDLGDQALPVSATKQQVIAQTTVSPATAGDCNRTGPKIRSVLPTLTSKFHIAKANPCVPLIGLVDEVLGVVPRSERAALAAFQDRLGRLVGAANTVNTVLTCAYQTDRLGIVLYQEKAQALSLGLVVAIRGKLDAAAEVAACYLKVTLTGFLADPPPGKPQVPCFHRGSRKQGGEDYSLFWVGSSEAMCLALAKLGG